MQWWWYELHYVFQRKRNKQLQQFSKVLIQNKNTQKLSSETLLIDDDIE